MTKLRLLLALIFGVILIALPSHATAVFQFDELGNLSFSLSGGPFVAVPDAFQITTDPTGGVSGDVLIYDLTSELNGFSLQNGDDPIENPYGTGILADLRFTDNQTGHPLTGNETCSESDGVDVIGCLMIFYVFDTNGLPADVGNISTSFLTTQTPVATLTNGAFSYTPDFDLYYDGTVVPEPGTAAMMLAGIAALGFLWKRSKAT